MHFDPPSAVPPFLSYGGERFSRNYFASLLIFKCISMHFIPLELCFFKIKFVNFLANDRECKNRLRSSVNR